MRKFICSAIVAFLFYSTPSFSQNIESNIDVREDVFSSLENQYEGSFVDEKTKSKGDWRLADGDKYVGSFRTKSQYVELGCNIEAEEMRIDNECFLSKNGTVEGCIEGDCVNGKGTYIYDEGNAKYMGSFKNEMPQGNGVCEYTNGELYDGEWVEGSFNGYGTLYLADGSPIRGYWKEGTFTGKQEPAVSVSVFQAQSPVVDNTIQTLADIRKNTKVKVHALIIGISTYTHMPVLKYSDDDAYRMYAFLKSPEGGALQDSQIRMLIDEEATRKNIKEAMVDIFMNAGKDDLVLMYYSGHGLKDCFLPIDFDRYNNKLFHDEVNEILRRSPAKYKLCIADACHSGGLAMKGGNDDYEYSDEQLINSYYSKLSESNAGTALILSSKLEEISLESSGLRQGVFSHFLIRGLEGEADRNKDKVVTVTELFEFISTNVKSYTSNRQSPIMRGVYDKEMTVSVVR